MVIKSFEGGRGVAAMLVALFHLALDKPRTLPIPHGYLYVDLFFVLSGMLIGGRYADRMQQPGALQVFLLRRFGRLFPLLIVASLSYVLVQNGIYLAKNMAISVDVGAQPHPAQLMAYVMPTLGEVAATISMTHALGFFDRPILNYASWSISTEFYAYVAFGLLCLGLGARARLAAFAALWLCGAVVTAWASVQLHHCDRLGGCLDLTNDFGFARCLSAFFLGALLQRLQPRVRIKPALLQAAAIAVLLLLFSTIDRYPLLALGVPAAFGLLLVSLGSDTGFLARLLATNPFQVLGERSYSIYLMHPVLLMLFNCMRPSIDGIAEIALFMLAYLCAILLVSGWTYRYIEDPLRRRFNALAQRRAVPAVAGKTRGYDPQV
jgi:peptidoglycan/LPS O-acetylase OafA/YrhL